MKGPSTDSGVMEVMDESTTSPIDPNSDDLPPYLREDPPEGGLESIPGQYPRWGENRIKVQACTHSIICYGLFGNDARLRRQVFGLWEETWRTQRKPTKHQQNMITLWLALSLFGRAAFRGPNM
ncbi:uncharacterized protein Hap1MRO34_012513 isoform 2-T2 [Clarias gariepinus]